jgi:hypothetical protein
MHHHPHANEWFHKHHHHSLTPTRMIVTYRRQLSRQRGNNMADLTLQIPLGPNSITIRVLDATGNDITSTCQITAQSADPTVVSIGTAQPGSPNVIPITALKEGGNTTITRTAVNSAGQLVETDTINIVVTAPASMVATYAQAVVITPAAPAAPAAPVAPAAN